MFAALLPRSQTGRYWSAQIGTWTAVALAHVALLTLAVGFEWDSAFMYALLAVLALFTSHALRVAGQRWQWHQLPFVRWLPIALASSLVAGCVLIAALAATSSLLAPLLLGRAMSWREMEAFRDPGRVAGLVMYWSFLLLAWQLFYLGYHLMQRLREAEVKRWRLEAAVTEAELRALKAQLDPHFVFNSLNGIRALVDEDPKRARDMITRLAGILRFTLRAGDRSTVPLREELETVRDYLALEAVRFEGRLECDFDVDPETLDVPVPPMVIQHLVENGIKHGVMNRPGRGRLQLVSQRDQRGDGGERLRIEVHNQGELRVGAGDGVGLEKSRERLRLLYGDEARVELEGSDGEVCARMTLPVAIA